MNLTKFLKDIYEDCKILAREKSIKSELELLKEDINIQGDKLHLRRLIFNLIHNAVKYTPRKGKIHLGLKNGSGGGTVCHYRLRCLAVLAACKPRHFS